MNVRGLVQIPAAALSAIASTVRGARRTDQISTGRGTLSGKAVREAKDIDVAILNGEPFVVETRTFTYADGGCDMLCRWYPVIDPAERAIFLEDT